MLIQLDHTYKHLKNKIILLALVLGLVITFISCENEDYNISNIKYEIWNYHAYEINEKNQIIKLYNYPLMKIGVELTNNNVELKNIHIDDSSKILSWDFKPHEFLLDDITILGSENINLASFDFEDGDYNLVCYDESAKKTTTIFKIDNPFVGKPNLNIVYENKKLIFINDINQNYSTTFKPGDFDLENKIIISYYDNNKNFLKSESVTNLILNESYPFEIQIDNSLQPVFINIEYKDENYIHTLINIKLSSTNSSL